jgi:purine-nucleoside phosphorylase
MDARIEKIQESAAFIQGRAGVSPRAGIILGTGLSGLAKSIDDAVRIPYIDIPNFPVSTVERHMGELILGSLSGIPVVAMAGRFHYYEGYSMQEVTFPVRVMKLLGIEHLVVSNAAGGVSEKVRQGDIAVITDHISLFPENPLRGRNMDIFGPRFPDLVDAYDGDLVNMAAVLAHDRGIDLKQVVYVGVPGPTLETRSEFGYFKAIGADVVGMSTIPEVIVARHMDLPVLAFSIVTNEGLSEDREPATVEDVIAESAKAASKLEVLVAAVLQSIYDIHV